MMGRSPMLAPPLPIPFPQQAGPLWVVAGRWSFQGHRWRHSATDLGPVVIKGRVTDPGRSKRRMI